MNNEEKYLTALEKARKIYSENEPQHVIGVISKALEEIFTKEELSPEPKYKNWEELVNSGEVKRMMILIDKDNSYTIKNSNSWVERKALSTLKISQLISYYGGEITPEEWNDSDQWKYTINPTTYGRELDNAEFKIVKVTNRSRYRFLAFHTLSQAELFLKNNMDLVIDYYGTISSENNI